MTIKKELNGNEIRLYVKIMKKTRVKKPTISWGWWSKTGRLCVKEENRFRGFGSIYMADDIYNNRMVAIKIDKNQKVNLNCKSNGIFIL